MAVTELEQAPEFLDDLDELIADYIADVILGEYE